MSPTGCLSVRSWNWDIHDPYTPIVRYAKFHSRNWHATWHNSPHLGQEASVYMLCCLLLVWLSECCLRLIYCSIEDVHHCRPPKTSEVKVINFLRARTRSCERPWCTVVATPCSERVQLSLLFWTLGLFDQVQVIVSGWCTFPLSLSGLCITSSAVSWKVLRLSHWLNFKTAPRTTIDWSGVVEHFFLDEIQVVEQLAYFVQSVE